MTTGVGKSAVPIKTGCVNSFTQPVHELLANEELRRIATAIKRYQHANPTASKAAIVAAMQHLKKQFGAIKQQFDDTAKLRPVLSRPPPATAVYGRFNKNAKIHDVGSGAGTRLIPWGGHLSITTIDIVDVELLGAIEFKMTIEEFLKLPEAGGDLIYTSFLSATLWSPAARVKVFSGDGLHLTINTGSCIRTGVSKQLEGDKIITNTSAGEIEENHFEAPGLDMSDYKLVATYADRQVEVNLDKTSVEDYTPDTFTYPVSLEAFDWSDVGYKFDGTMLELESHGGRAVMTDRAGNVRSGVSSINFSYCLLLEYMKEPDPVYVIIRVLWWRHYTPPHCGALLREFGARVRFKINGIKVVPPPAYDHLKMAMIEGKEYPTDGVISRSTYTDKDVYVKHQWTVDLRKEDLEELEKRLIKRGLRLVKEGDMVGGLAEYAVSLRNDQVVLRFVRIRKDRLKSTAIETVLWYLETTDLSACQALNRNVANTGSV